MPLIPRAPRTVKLNGDPLKWSLTSVFNSCRELVHAACLATPFLGAAVLQGDSSNMPILCALNVAFGVAASSLMYRTFTERINLQMSFGEARSRLYVVKDNKDEQTKPINLIKAQQALRASRFSLAWQTTFFGLLAADNFVAAAQGISGAIPIDPRHAFISALFLNDMLSEMGNINRFRKVLKGEWVITDTPPPVHSSEKFSVNLPEFSRPQPALGATYQAV